MPVYSPIMLALCFMLLVTYYALNYAGIIGLGLFECGEYIARKMMKQHCLQHCNNTNQNKNDVC